MKKIILVVLVCSLMISVTGCSTNTGTGAAIGGGLGAIAGQLLGGNRTATLVGAGIGALVGAAIGGYIDVQNKNRRESARDLGYNPSQGQIVRVENVDAAPVSVKCGETVGLKASYYVMAPNPQTKVTIKETRIVRYNGQPVVEPIIRTVDKQQGLTSSTAKMKIPDEAPAGEYEVITVIDNGNQRDTKTGKFYVQSI